MYKTIKHKGWSSLCWTVNILERKNKSIQYNKLVFGNILLNDLDDNKFSVIKFNPNQPKPAVSQPSVVSWVKTP